MQCDVPLFEIRMKNITPSIQGEACAEIQDTFSQTDNHFSHFHAKDNVGGHK